MRVDQGDDSAERGVMLTAGTHSKLFESDKTLHHGRLDNAQRVHFGDAPHNLQANQ